MNYRHAFHAGNFADCMKHALLLWLLRAMQRKLAPFCVLDTHAGAGRYDLASGPAARTGEWRAGIGLLLERPCPALADYLGTIQSLGLYPGSPALARALLRPGDRLVCCELHPDDAATLRSTFKGDRQVQVHRRDGWEAVRALLPPAERRGFVLIDPPYENPDEFFTLERTLAAAYGRFRSGVYAAWYPIKHRAPVRAFHAALRNTGLRDVVAAELLLREPLDPARLNGCGLLLVNPPWGFEQEAPRLLAALQDALAEKDGSSAVLRLADE